MLQLLLLASSLLGCASALSDNDRFQMIDYELGRSYVIKVDTPGYPFWLMDKANAPVLQKDSGPFYWAMDEPSAVLLNITLAHDKRTLLINHVPVLPLENYNVPPRIHAYQVPGTITTERIQGLANMGLLRGEWDGLTLGYRWLELDYDRLVDGDPEQSRFYNHNPVLKFRIMGIGAHDRSDKLEKELQKAVWVALKMEKGFASDEPDREYRIEYVQQWSYEKSYQGWHNRATQDEDRCSLWSWRCPDGGQIIYSNDKPWYRFIWREKFDNYGRIGSLRHAIYKTAGAVGRVWSESWRAILLSFGILFGAAMMGLGLVKLVKYYTARRIQRIRGLAEDDSLLGDKEAMDFGEGEYVDGDEEGEEVPPPLPPRPGSVKKDEHELLIDLEESK